MLADLQITLRAEQRGMTQQRLNGSQIHPGFQKVSSKTVPQGIIILLTNFLFRRSIIDITRFMEPKSK